MSDVEDILGSVTETPPSQDVPFDITELKRLALGDLYLFAKGILGYDYFYPGVHKPLCRLLELYDGWNDSLRFGREVYEEVLRSPHIKPTLSDEQIDECLTRGIKKLQVVLPRGWLKTTLCSVSYPTWRAARNSEVRGLLVQNTFSNASAKNAMIRQQWERNPLLRAMFPDLLPGPRERWRDDSLCLKRQGSFAESTFEAAGTKTAVTSRHFDFILEDDTVSPDKDELGEENIAPTKDDVAQAIGWHRLVPPLLIHPRDSQNIVVGTRWFEKDLISWQREHDTVGLVCYQRACLEDDQGQASETGRVTFPRFDEKVLESLRQTMGPYMFSCLYLNKPVRSDDMLFQPEWISYYDSAPTRLLIYTTVDLGGDPADTKGEPDYNVVMTTGKDPMSGKIYVLDYYHAKSSPGELLNALFRHVRTYQPLVVGIETVAYQKAMKYFVRERQKAEGLWFQILGLTWGKRSKSMRIMGLQPVFASGSIVLRAWMKDLVRELLSYPLAQNDDLPDALSMQTELWRLTRGEERKRQQQKCEDDALDVTSAMKSIRDRRKKPKGSVLDVLDRESMRDYGGV